MPLYYSNFKSFSNKISRIFWYEQPYVRPLLAVLKDQYRPWAQRGRPAQGWYGWISTLWCYRKLPDNGHWIPGLPKQIMATLLWGYRNMPKSCGQIKIKGLCKKISICLKFYGIMTSLLLYICPSCLLIGPWFQISRLEYHQYSESLI